MNPTPDGRHQSPQQPVQQSPQPPEPVRIPAPTGPNWGLLSYGVLMLGGAVAMLAYLSGARMTATVSWPAVFVLGGLGLVLIGQVGLVRRRRRSRLR